MELFDNLILGFSVAFTLTNLSYCFAGVLLGTLVGVLPGLGPTATIAMLLPATFVLPPISALIMLSGIYYGSQYGGSTTAILINLPGESASVVTAIDGYQMARQGRAGTALAAAAIGSFFAGTVATFLIALFGPPLAGIALKFGPAEYFSLMLLGLVASVALAHGSLLKALGMIALGLLLGMVGQDVETGTARYTFGIPELSQGINFVAISMGLFGIAEIIRNLENEHQREVMVSKVTGLMPTRADLRAMVAPILRGTTLGSILGILPGGGSILSSFAAYSLEKKISRTPGRFGKGAIEGVAGPESANNAGAQTSFIPMLTLGIPPTPVMALMVGAMIIKGIQPGPLVMTEQPELFWGLIASMWIGNFFLIVLNLPLIGIWVRLLKVPYHLLYPAILAFCCIGVYSLSNNVFDVYLTVVFSLVGYVLIKLDCEPAPLLLGFILGPMMEENLRRAMLLSRGDPTVFATRPISAVLLVLTALVLLVMISPAIRRKREEAFQEEAG
ncbi:TctA family transporter [Inquilinus ginsengisoli]|uniref:TctA family transporter n=1 Tax=Inquilinus ginsengisoli TaxID=363840 RepID=A0ABU1JKX0_9PROT|nr:tripartite tricarboxylate transporter permease [Inquilinus ginsengisoli]MDR6288674.1 TctA family transporter [Inquilinus ginsengisoli]